MADQSKYSNTLTLNKYPHNERWYIIYVKSRTEKKVAERLQRQGIQVFLPLIKTLRQWSDRKKMVHVPLFTVYIFVYITPDEFTTVKMIEAVVKFVNVEGKYAILPAEKIDAIKKFLETGLPIEATNESFNPGEKVKITFGPLKGYEGELIDIKNEKQFIIRLDVINQVLKLSVPVNYLEKV